MLRILRQFKLFVLRYTGWHTWTGRSITSLFLEIVKTVEIKICTVSRDGQRESLEDPLRSFKVEDFYVR